MGLRQDARDNYLSLIIQLYDDWHGWYCVMELRHGTCVERHPGSRVSRHAALVWRNPDPSRYSLDVRLS